LGATNLHVGVFVLNRVTEHLRRTDNLQHERTTLCELPRITKDPIGRESTARYSKAIEGNIPDKFPPSLAGQIIQRVSNDPGTFEGARDLFGARLPSTMEFPNGKRPSTYVHDMRWREASETNKAEPPENTVRAEMLSQKFLISQAILQGEDRRCAMKQRRNQLGKEKAGSCFHRDDHEVADTHFGRRAEDFRHGEMDISSRCAAHANPLSQGLICSTTHKKSHIAPGCREPSPIIKPDSPRANNPNLASLHSMQRIKRAMLVHNRLIVKSPPRFTSPVLPFCVHLRDRQALYMTPFELSVLFFLQVAVILGVCRIVGALAVRVGQPQVVGEMIAGVLLGPSFFGMFKPDWQAALFPEESKAILFAVSQVGLAIYMFVVGVEFDIRLIKSRARSAAAVSISGILAPFLLGASAAWFLAPHYPLFTGKVTQLEGMLFLGAAMCITAFPMLARIIYERGLSGTSLGTLTLAAGSIDDAAAWCVLAVVLASFSDNAMIAVLAIGGGIAYVVVVRFAGAPILRAMARRCEAAGELTHGMLGAMLCLVMLGAWFTDVIGIYAVFGAFILGVAVPKGFFAKALQGHLEKMTTAFLLPMFFVYSGLNTKISLIVGSELIGVTILLLLLAVIGKGAACAAAARLSGEPVRESLAIGALMNARGLMELIILNIGLQRGVITPTLFTMMVVMAVVTTLMATPLFQLVYGNRRPA